MERQTYPLTTAQLLNYRNLIDFRQPQVLNIGACLTIQAPLDFEILRRALIREFARNESLRVRFCQRGGQVLQYIVPQETQTVRFEDFSRMTEEEAVGTLRGWTAVPFPRWDAPMHQFTMVAMPGGYNGIYVKIDHLITDSTSVILMINDIMELYCQEQFGTAMPAPLASYRESLENDLAALRHPGRRASDSAFWDKMLDALGEPIYTDVTGGRLLEASRERHRNPSLRCADMERDRLEVGISTYFLEPIPTRRLLAFCKQCNVPVTSFLLMGLRTYLSRVNGGERDIGLRSFVSRRTPARNRRAGGVRVHAYPCRTVLEPGMPFLEGAGAIHQACLQIYRHCNYDPAEIAAKQRERFGTPPHTMYEGLSLTYQPLPLRLQNDCVRGIPYQARWLSNGTAVQPMYLTVMHNAANLGMEFYFKYQRAVLTPDEVERTYDCLMRILFYVMDHPGCTIGEVMGAV